NEDSFGVISALNLYVISDGMGGVAHGEVASALAIKTVLEYCQDVTNNPATAAWGEQRPDLSEQTNRLASAAYLANHSISEAAIRNPAQHGMGATLVAAWIGSRRLSVVNVGDSRAYLLRSGVLERLTSDHTLVAEQVRRGIITQQQADTSKLQSVLIRALGVQDEVESDAHERELLPGDAVLICTDGLTRMVPDSEIAATVMKNSGAQAAADRLVELALERGGEDNVTVIVARVAGTG
ncbi:MAG: protein phosphatase 2C domain-containing protein, partial [Candidatus Acidiferrales bacterium]